MLDTVLMCDCNKFLSTRLLSVAVAKKNSEKKIASAVTKKLASVLNLERTSSDSAPIHKNIVSPSRIKRNSKRLKTKNSVITEFLEYQQSVVNNYRCRILQLIQLLKIDY